MRASTPHPRLRPRDSGWHHRTALAVALCLSLTSACGMASRMRYASMDLQESQGEPARLEEVRGADPAFTPVWGVSAMTAAQISPDAAFEIIDRGLRHQPANADLILMRIDLLARIGREQELEEALDAAMGSLPQGPVRAWLRSARVRAHLAVSDLDAAEAEILRLGGEPDVDRHILADSWARLALVAEYMGQSERADLAMDRSIDRGPDGRHALVNEVAFREERGAAARSLRVRTAERHPGHPDSALAVVIDQMIEGDFETAERGISELPAPVPGRLASEVYALKARLELLQGEDAAGLEILRYQLQRNPTDGYALEVLLESWAVRNVPDDEETDALLRRTWRALRPGQLRTRIEQVLTEIHRRKQADEVPSPPTNADPGADSAGDDDAG